MHNVVSAEFCTNGLYSTMYFYLTMYLLFGDFNKDCMIFSRRCGVFALGQLCAEKGGKLGEQKSKSQKWGLQENLVRRAWGASCIGITHVYNYIQMLWLIQIKFGLIVLVLLAS